MCGIIGRVNISDHYNVQHGLHIQRHRGPDSQGTWEYNKGENNIELGSNRLAILDLSSAGQMPMLSDDKLISIVYNGEVYNYPELRKELEALGYRFRSNSDTEAILYLYERYGPDCVKRLNGMFAIAICDSRSGFPKVFLARDHFGIKPLYYYQDKGRLAFASEIKSLLELLDIQRTLNYQALHQYLTFLWVPDPLTLFEGIYKIPAGHYAVWNGTELELTKYWDLQFPEIGHSFSTNEIDLRDELRHRFIATVKSQMLSDVPLGAFLSAGLDSSSIVAAMHQVSNDPIRTFTISFPPKYRKGETTLDDTNVARRTAARLGCIHKDIVVEPDIVDLLPKLVWHLDEPISDPAAITSYLVCQEARKDVTVLLSGIGGDELFAGYRKYQAHYMARRYQAIPQMVRRGFIEPVIMALPGFRGTSLKGHVRLAKKMARSGSLPSKDRFIMDSVYLTDPQKQELYTRPIASLINGIDPRFRHLDYFEAVGDADFLNQMLYVDTKAFMTSLNLTYNDKMSMASSVEVRVPFLDWELAEWAAWNIPPELKLKGGTTKHILREAMRPLLPPEVLTQKKAGFGAPADYWLAHDLQEMVDDLLSESTLKKRGLFNPQVVRRYVEEQRRGKEDWSLQIWQFLTLELWMQAFLD